MVAQALTPLAYSLVYPAQVITDESDAIVVLDLAILAEELLLTLHAHAVFGDEAGNVAVVVAQVSKDVVDALLVNLPATVRVHLASRHLVVVKEPLGHEGAGGVDRVAAGLDPARLVVVDPEQIHLAGCQQCAIPRLADRKLIVFTQQRHKLSRKFALDRRIQEAAVEHQIGDVGRLQIRRMLGTRIGGGQVQDDADLAILALGAIGLHSLGVGQHGVVSHGGGSAKIHHVRVVEVVEVTPFHRHYRFVEGEPVLHLAPEQPEAGGGELGEGVDHLAALPAPLFLHAHGHIEVEQVDEGGDTVYQQLVEHGVVEAHRLRVWLPPPFGQQTGPGDGGTKAVVTNLRHQGDIIAKVLVEGGGVGRTHLLMEAARRRGEPVIPDGRSLAPLQACAFGLRGG